ncbi:hypothetical protein GDO81_022184 [Engystomops pustulosus]|uniref:Bag6 BAG-similar domain-containing protein n=1 Tax=Engystomops pustulosus TaxID=76066 RepID=A0AAV6YY61_ENGPU|nr:hypothetical protein GDO81_022184 [Engystomops pustulosus]
MLVSWVTSVLSLRLQVLLGQMPVTEAEVQRHVRRIRDPPAVPEAASQEQPMETSPADAQEWVPVIRQDIQSQRKMKQQPPLSDAYLSGMPAKRRKTMQGEGPHLSLSEAVNRAMRYTGAKPETSAESLRRELDSSEVQVRYRDQLCQDIQKILQDNESYSPQRFPNTPRAFQGDP